MKNKQEVCVFRPRKLVEAKYGITKTQNDVMDYVIGVVLAEDDVDRSNLVYELKISDFVPYYDASNEKSIYTNFRNMVSMSIKDTFLVESEDGRDEAECFWAQSAYYDNVDHRVKVKLGEDFKNILNAVKKERGAGAYYNLSTAFSLSSQYSKRIYYMCKEWAGKGSTNTRYDTVDGLREKLRVPGSYCYGMFKERVLEKAVDEINKKTDITISYDEIKKKGLGGSKVIGVTWHIQRKSQIAGGQVDGQ